MQWGKPITITVMEFAHTVGQVEIITRGHLITMGTCFYPFLTSNVPHGHFQSECEQKLTFQEPLVHVIIE